MAQHEGAKAPEVSALFSVLLPDTPLTDLLDRVTQLACRTVPDCTLAGITMAQGRGYQTAVYTDERLPRLDQVQYDNDAGPGLDALRGGEVVEITDTAVDTRWRAFCDAAVAEGIRSTLSVPMDVSGNRTDVLGALNLYSDEPDAFGPATQAAAESFAQQAAIVVANAKAYWGVKEESEHLQIALESRAVIEQAKGVIMCQSHLNAEQAFDVLRRASQRENRKIRDIAEGIVKAAAHPPGQPKAS
jgi:GAF domain-containing protein